MLACSAALLFSCQDKTQNIKIDKPETAMEKKNIYQFKVEDLSGNTFDFSTLREESNDRKYSFKMWIDTAV
jgi:glutathione peroxidase